MEFRFNVNRLLPKKINKITHTLLPEDFRGDRREILECQRQMTKLIDEMGEASAKSQGLSKPITSAQKLKDTDHHLYLMVDESGNSGMGSVVGLLKTGSKTLFMFDEAGLQYQLKPRCILDFYIHESQQRMGLGKALYQHMLMEENTRPIKLAIDRPSEKFLTFLNKHYQLSSVIPQNNKFVVFSGFFDDEIEDTKTSRYAVSPRSSIDSRASINNDNHNSPNGINGTPAARSSYGRYAANRPPCHMANIIHNTAMLGQPTERTGRRYASPGKSERPQSLSLYPEEDEKRVEAEDEEEEIEDAMNLAINMNVNNGANERRQVHDQIHNDSEEPEKEQLDRVDEKGIQDEAKVEKELGRQTPSCEQQGAGGNNQSGHLDLKFYHSPLW